MKKVNLNRKYVGILSSIDFAGIGKYRYLIFTKVTLRKRQLFLFRYIPLIFIYSIIFFTGRPAGIAAFDWALVVPRHPNLRFIAAASSS